MPLKKFEKILRYNHFNVFLLRKYFEIKKRQKKPLQNFQ